MSELPKELQDELDILEQPSPELTKALEQARQEGQDARTIQLIEEVLESYKQQVHMAVRGIGQAIVT